VFVEFLEGFGSGCHASVTLALEHVADCLLEIPASKTSAINFVAFGLCTFVHRQSPFMGILGDLDLSAWGKS
jgi:hypothetical protein